MMSNLHKAIYPLVPTSQYLLSNEAMEVEGNIKSLINEIIGDDEIDTCCMHSIDIIARNKLRAQLRQKVEAL